MKMLLRIGCIVASTLFVCSSVVGDVLIVGAPGTGTDVLDDIRSKIIGTGILAGHNVDWIDLSVVTPASDDLATYDAVLSFTDSSPNDPALWGDLLADFVDGGGGVLQMTFSWNIDPAGRWFSGGYSPLLVDDQTGSSNAGIGTVHCSIHPVLRNVKSFDGGTSSFRNTGGFAPGSIPIADWDDGLPFAAEMPGFNARIIGLNFLPPSSDADPGFWDASTDGDLLMANALAYVLDPPGATVKRHQIKDGTQKNGDVSSLKASDDDSLKVRSELKREKQRVKTIVHLAAGCIGVTRLDLRVETGANRGNIKTRIHMFDFEAGRWRLIKTFNQTRADRSRRFHNLSNPDRFVRDSDGRIKVRVSTVHRNNSYTLEIDHVQVVVRH